MALPDAALLGATHGIRQAVPDAAEHRQIAAIIHGPARPGDGGFAAHQLAGRGIDGVAPDPVVVQGLDPVHRYARAAVEADIRGRAPA